MNPQGRGGPAGGGTLVDDLVMWVLAALAAAGGATWGGAQLATLVGSGRPLPVGVGSAMQALLRLPTTLGRPAVAWPDEVRDLIPGPVLYWSATAMAVAAVAALAAVAYHLLRGQRAGTERRRRLGVDTRAHLARPHEIAPLVVPGPCPGRLVLGRVGHRLVATERRDRRRTRRWGRRGRRRGDRSAVAVIGPTRCGKTANVISGVLEWEGPAILSSVKDDLLEATIARRRRLGEVKVFDPTGTTGEPCAQWTPLRACTTPTGAQKAARMLADSQRGATREDASFAFFADLASQVLWALFYTAAVSGHTMSDVLRWVLTTDRPTPKDRGQVAGLLDVELASDDRRRRRFAGDALRALTGTWEKDPRTTSNIYVTAQRMLGVWQDPNVLDNAQRCEIDLEWLLSGDNTLYVCAPVNEQDRLSVVFGALLSDLIAQQVYEWAARHDGPMPDLLAVLDEAANTPTRWLPAVASTCSGLGLLLVTIWQSKAQIDDAYGTLADSVLTNHGSKVIFSGLSDPSTLEYVSRLLGDEEVRQHGLSFDLAGGARSISESTTRERLLPGDVLRQAEPDNALLIHGTLPPAHLRARPYYANRRLRALAGLGRQPGRAGTRDGTAPAPTDGGTAA